MLFLLFLDTDILGIAGIARAIPAIPDIGTRNSNRNSKYAAGIAHSRGILCTGSRVLACRACTQTCVRPTCAWSTVHGRLARTAAWPTRPSGTCPRSLCPRSLCQRSLCPRSLSPRSPGPQPLGYSRAGVRAQLGGGGGGWSDDERRSMAGQDGQDKREAEGHQGRGQDGGGQDGGRRGGHDGGGLDGGGLGGGGRDDERGGWRWPQQTQPAARGTGAHLTAAVSHRSANARQARVGRHRVGKRARARIYLQPPAARSCWSCWLREELDQARARADHLEVVTLRKRARRHPIGMRHGVRGKGG